MISIQGELHEAPVLSVKGQAFTTMKAKLTSCERLWSCRWGQGITQDYTRIYTRGKSMITNEHKRMCKNCHNSEVITANGDFRFVGCRLIHGKWIAELKCCPMGKWKEQEHE